MNSLVAWREELRLWKFLVVVVLGASGRGPWIRGKLYTLVEVVSEFVLDEVADEYAVPVLIDGVHDAVGRHL